MVKNKPKHQSIFEALSRDIRAGRYTPGAKFPSEAALMHRFSVSRITVGRAVRDLQERGLVERFAGSGTYVRRGDEAARQGLVFGLIIPDLGTTEIFEPICQGIANAPDAAGHALLWPHSGRLSSDREQQALELCEQCIERRVAGVFFAPIEMTARATEVDRRVVAALGRAGIPTVFLDRRPYETTGRERCDLVSIDNQRAGLLATGHLISCGARNIGFVAYRGQASSVTGRIAGYRQALRGMGQVFHLQNGVLPEKAERCDGLVCSNDRVAGEVMQILLAQGRQIPRDVRIVGMDDVMYASLLPVPLTTIRQPCAEIGRTAVQLMLDRVARPKMPARDVLINCELVVRKSCGC